MWEEPSWAPWVKEGNVAEERLKLAIFIDFDNIQIGVKETLGKDFDVSIVLEALKERGEVVSKIAYGDWPRAGEYSRQMTQHAVQMVQRSVTPRGDKNGADINLALDALEMAFTRDHINTFVIVGGDSDFIALVEKLKQYDKRVFVVGGRQFTSGILQRNCHEFLSYENLLKGGGDGSRAQRAQRAAGRIAESRPLATALPNIERALEILAEREVSPQLGLLKSTLLQLDPTFSERDFGASSFLEFIQKLRKAGLVEMRRTDRGYLVEALEAEGSRETTGEAAEGVVEAESTPAAPEGAAGESPASSASLEATPAAPAPAALPLATPEESLAALQKALPAYFEKAPNRPLYLRQIRQILRAAGNSLDERSGFRGVLDILHQAQREGWLRLHRDRKGVWRVFPVPTPATVPPVSGEAASEAMSEATPALEPEPWHAETDVDWETSEQAEEEAEMAEALAGPEIAEGSETAELLEASNLPEPVAASVGEESASLEPVVGRKPRKRTARAGKSGTRKPSTRRKTKEATEP